jgi:hypothetical protein
MKLLDSGYLDIAKLKQLLGISDPVEDTRTYSADELAELNKVIAATGNYSALSDNVKAQLENTYTPYEKWLRSYSYAKQAAEKEELPLHLGMLSLGTGGVSDIAQGKAPGSSLGDWSLFTDVFNPAFASAYGTVDSLKEGNWAKALNYAVDPVTEPGLDKIATTSGKQLEKLVPGVTQWGPTVGALIGTIASPVPGVGTIAGYELGNKIKGGSELEGLIGGAAIGATYGLSDLLSPYISPYISGISATVGNTLDDVVGGTLAGTIGEKATSWAGNALINNLIKKGVNTGANALLGALTPSVANELSGLLTGSTGTDTTTAGTGTTTGGLLSTAKTNLLSTPEVATTLPVAKTTTELTPIDWTSQLKKLSMPIELKKKKDKDEDDYMNYTFKPKDYLVNYL